MLALDTIDPAKNRIADPVMLREQLTELKRAGCEGVMADVWWGIVERDGPGKYDWTGYQELVELVASLGLKLQAVMSFHQCGGNVGDHCFIPMPEWVLEVGMKNPDIYYTDMSMNRNREYLSLGVDNEPLFQGRSPLDVYEDFMTSFRMTFNPFIPNVIVEAQIGLGPAGEMRYPSYPLAFWNFPGVGQFQCYDKYMRRELIRHAGTAGKPEYGLIWPPHHDDVGNYNFSVDHTEFFKADGLWTTEQGEFFLEWYSAMLIAHGDAVLERAQEAFKGSNIMLAAKVAGIHWQSKTQSHGPELTAGYYNTEERNGYLPIAQMFAKRGAVFDFTCLEMHNSELPEWARSAPEGLVHQCQEAAKQAGCLFAGENALPRVDRVGYVQMQDQCQHAGKVMASFTYLRLNDHLMDDGQNWIEFARFVAEMKSGRRFEFWTAPPASKRQKRPHVRDHIDLDESDLKRMSRMLRFGGRNIIGVDDAPPDNDPAALAKRLTPPKRLPLVSHGVQAGTQAGRNGVPMPGIKKLSTVTLGSESSKPFTL